MAKCCSLLKSFSSVTCWQTVVEMCSLLPGTRLAELLVSILALFVLILVKEVNGCYSHKLPLPIPIELIVASTLNPQQRAPQPHSISSKSQSRSRTLRVVVLFDR